MKRKILFLIIGCIVTVSALAVIQGYFIYNTYKLKAKEANAEITSQFLALETSGKLDTLNSVWMIRTGKFIEDYYNQKASKDEYEDMITKVADSLSGIMGKYVNSNKIFEEYEVNYIDYLKTIVLFREGSKIPDTIFKGKLMLYGNNEARTPETAASQSTWRDGKYTDSSLKKTNYTFEVVSQRYYSIANWERQVYIKMAGLLIFSVVLLSFVVILFYLSIKNLITQKKIAEIKTDFINNITHEFQTPIAALDIAVKTLRKKEGELTEEHFRHSLEIIDRQNIRMQKLFGQVTEASLTEGSITAAREQYIDRNCINEILEDFMLSHPDIKIENNVTATTFRMDRFHFSTMLINLLDNAVKYGADCITINLKEDNDKVTLSVNDNGIGIAKKEQKAIFEKFYRVQKGNIHTSKGLGLGLFYVQQLVKAYKGYITVNSDEGKGAEFLISIPKP
ncbi:sensor histidine kinase [Flavobacterium sp. AG291]|uniref:sensor histidine kinase n=1 Tax=Flavobacterium sp. AG291 TaxID=2184000 RepID=UPI000E0B3100|nr:HAMP domain-containing sensor histidine kinase [Flavobacterium sp. AG291]RDI15949.1 phospho-acceptor domain-containing protein [Flavobacterium sp. AG291]